MNLRAFALLALALLGCAASASAQRASASAGVGATIVGAIGLSNSHDLDFGSIVASSNPGTVVLAANGERSKTGGLSLSTQGSTPTAATFTAIGEPNYAYAVTLPQSVTLTRNGGAEMMTVQSLTTDASRTLGAGTETFHVGGTLQLGPAQAPGAYSGAFKVTIAYN